VNSEKRRPVIRYSGISPERLLEWVGASVPWIFDLRLEDSHPRAGWLGILKQARVRLPELSDLYGYFDLCVASHFATVGSFVPTDVDLAIREKLWGFVHSEDVLEHLWERVAAFREWDETPVSNRRVTGRGGSVLSGIQGEWLTLAMGAYATARRLSSSRVSDIREAIEEEVSRELATLLGIREEFQEAPGAEGMKRYLGATAAVAHNLGDLDRMFDAFGLDEQDVLRRRVYRSGHEDARHPRPAFVEAGRVYQALVAAENHRNFALREPKGLRRSARFLLPFGLFLDQWGEDAVVGGFREGELNEGDLREIIEALVLGWQKLNPKSIYTSQGYSRALVGIAKGLGGRQQLEGAVPPVIRKALSESGLRTLLGVSREEFERKMVTRLRLELARATFELKPQ
jgi:hypothetical protein